MNKATIISSRAIAEIIGKRHLDVCRDISEMLKEIHGADMNIEDIDGAATSYSRDGKVSEYYLDKQHAFALALGYGDNWQIKIFRHLHNLDEAAAKRPPATERFKTAAGMIEILEAEKAEKARLSLASVRDGSVGGAA